ncbi:hypothetical protein [Desulfoluna sp.]|uniref:hypothetical protein n=1 Tax=Desulfoluna sp. TaxID=2045199 RepID=UPI00260D62D9|nr:hypothetical protein [Desulfoluna sp.]
MTDYYDEYEHDIPYKVWDDINFGIITMGLKRLPFFKDDLYLGMQAMNVGIVDSVITEYEYSLLREWFEIERTPTETAMAVSAMSQMWIYGLYETLRLWRDRKFQFQKLHDNGGIDLKVDNMSQGDPNNITIEIRKRQLIKYKEDSDYRDSVNDTWEKLEHSYRMTELFRMNLAKHCAPGKNGAVPRAPGYGRINRWCGSMDFELIDKNGYYTYMNRRDIADGLRNALENV